MAALGCGQSGLPAYDLRLLAEELSRFPDWFVDSLLGYSPDTSERALLEGCSPR